MSVHARAAVGSTPAVDVTRNLTYKLLKLSNTLGKSAAQVFEQGAGLTVPEWRIASVIGSSGPLTLDGIARSIAVDKAWVHRTLAKLEARGLIARSDNADDGRQYLYALTRAGRAAHLKGSAISLGRQQRLAGSMTPQQLALLEDLLERLQGVADQLVDEASGK